MLNERKRANLASNSCRPAIVQTFGTHHDHAINSGFEGQPKSEEPHLPIRRRTVIAVAGLIKQSYDMRLRHSAYTCAEDLPPGAPLRSIWPSGELIEVHTVRVAYLLLHCSTAVASQEYDRGRARCLCPKGQVAVKRLFWVSSNLQKLSSNVIASQAFSQAAPSHRLMNLTDPKKRLTARLPFIFGSGHFWAPFPDY